MSRIDLINFEDRVESGHLQYKCKCLGCGLHFSVHSWYEDWKKKVGAPYCPECGGQGVMVITAKKSDKNIYEEVPGRVEIDG